ncbi:MAG: ROK family protein [Pseudomonadales bacterium]|nr:ROK family protein [Pseudomonadales bacterium]
MSEFRAGIDLGGTKIEIIVLKVGVEVFRQRVATPSDSYEKILQAIVQLHADAKAGLGLAELRLGIGLPGAFTEQGRVKNSNTVCLNGRDFKSDLQALLKQPLLLMNDANLFALSEAVDGAAAKGDIVFGVILGTGVGGGLIINKSIISGANRIAGEWGHNVMSALAPVASKNPRLCYCGLNNCVETYLSGAGLSQSFVELGGGNITAKHIAELYLTGHTVAVCAMALYIRQAAAALAGVINVLDPEVIVLGGGLSNIPGLAKRIEAALLPFVFSDTLNTKVLKNIHGDSSGVRGAAWLCV